MKGREVYSSEFREQAVKRTLSGSHTIKEVAKSLGISYYALKKWRKEYIEKMEEEKPKTDQELKESEELKRLRRENLRLKEDNAILKKFAAMLSREQNLD